MEKDFDLLVVGAETEGCLAAIAAARMGAKVALLAPDERLGGLLTRGGLAYVDRDSRHLLNPGACPEDGLFGEFLLRAGVELVALDPSKGESTLSSMLKENQVNRIVGTPVAAKIDRGCLTWLRLQDGERLSAKFFIDATPDGDLAEMAGISFASGFREYGISRFLGVSPLPVVKGVSPERIFETCRRLSEYEELENLRRKIFGERRFNALEKSADYLLIGPPHLGLAYQRWRENRGLPFSFPFEADGFNVAVLGPETTSWNGLIYFSEDLDVLLNWSRQGADDFFREETGLFEHFLQEGLGWKEALVELPDHLYVRQTRHALGSRHRLSLGEIARGFDRESIGTFSYYPDFRGFRAVAVPHPLVAPIPIQAGLFEKVLNLGIASRAGGYTPFGHSLCRLGQFNATLGAALGVSAALANRDLGEIPAREIKESLERLGMLANDSTGLDKNREVLAALETDPLFALEEKG